MDRIGVGVEEADAHRADAPVPEPSGLLGGFFSIERAKDIARGREALLDLAHPLGGDERLGRAVQKGGGEMTSVAAAGELGHAANLEHVAEAAGENQAQVFEPPLEDGVRGHGGSVIDADDLPGPDFHLGHDLADALEKPLAVVRGRGWGFGGEDFAGVGPHADHVSEGSARVDADAVAALRRHMNGSLTSEEESRGSGAEKAAHLGEGERLAQKQCGQNSGDTRIDGREGDDGGGVSTRSAQRQGEKQHGHQGG